MKRYGHLGVPVTVKDDDCVGGGKIDAQTSRTCRQQERKLSRPKRIEVLHCLHHRHIVHATAQGTLMVEGSGNVTLAITATLFAFG